MQIAYHIGTHYTDNDKLLKCLLKNKEDLLNQGILVPGPGQYRDQIKSAVFRAIEEEDAAAIRAEFLEAALDGTPADRLVISNDQFLSGPRRILERGQLYRLSRQRTEALNRIFGQDQLEIHLAIRNLASFIPEAFAPSQDQTFEQFLQDTDLDMLSWTDVVVAIREAAPYANITVWCNEDTPLLWSQLIRELSGIDPTSKIVGGFDLLADIMSDEGMRRLMDYLKSHPPQTEVQKRRVIAAFLDKFALEDEIEEELDLPGWTEEIVDDLTEAYEEDVYNISRIPGVTFISP